MNFTFWIIVFLILFIFSLCMLKKDKILMFLKTIKWRKNPKKQRRKNKNGKKEDNKVKVAETQIRPILLPPNQKTTMLNSPEKQEQLNPPKEGDNNVDETEKLDTNLIALNKRDEKKLIAPSQTGTLNLTSTQIKNSNENTKPNLFSKDRFSTSSDRYKTREEIDKEFEEVRKFLDIPSKSTIPQKKIYNQSPFLNNSKSNNLINNSFANEKFLNNEFSNGSINNFSNSNFNKSFQNESLNDNIKTKNDFINIPQKNNSFEQKFSQYTNKSLQKNIVKVDDDEIDLNKLPSNLKKILISNILSRKNFD